MFFRLCDELLLEEIRICRVILEGSTRRISRFSLQLVVWHGHGEVVNLEGNDGVLRLDLLCLF